jgi:hypothetical protein
MMETNNKLCNERHGRIDKRLEILEGRWDKMQNLLVGTLVAVICNLIGLVILIFSKFFGG